MSSNSQLQDQQDQEQIPKPVSNYQFNWDEDDEEDDDDGDQEIGIQKTNSQKQKSLISQDIKRNIEQIIDDENEEEFKQEMRNAGGQVLHRKANFPNKNINDQFDQMSLGDDRQRKGGPSSQGAFQKGFQKPKKFDQSEIDTESNYRQFYLNNREFYKWVIDQDEPGPGGYKFKVMVFNIEHEEKAQLEQEKIIFLALTELNAEDIQINALQDKFKCFCNVKEKEDAKKMYTHLWKYLEEPLKSKVYLELPEKELVRYGDIAAELYQQNQKLEEEKEKQFEEQEKLYQQDRQFDQRGKRDGGNRRVEESHQEYNNRPGRDANSYQYLDKNQRPTDNFSNKQGREDKQHFKQGRNDYTNSHYNQGQNQRKDSKAVYQSTSNYSEEEEQILEAEKHGIKFMGKPSFFKGANPNEDRENPRKVYSSSQGIQQQPEDKAQIRTVTQTGQLQFQPKQGSHQYQDQVRQVEIREKQQYSQYNKADNQLFRPNQSQKEYYQEQPMYQKQVEEDNYYYAKNQKKPRFDKPTGGVGSYRGKQNDQRSNYDYETHSQISDTLSQHSYKTDNQDYKVGRYKAQKKPSQNYNQYEYQQQQYDLQGEGRYQNQNSTNSRNNNYQNQSKYQTYSSGNQNNRRGGGQGYSRGGYSQYY